MSAEVDRTARAVADLGPTTHAAPVFVDTTGKRRRWIRRGSILLIVSLTAYGVVVALSFLGGPVPPNALLPLPGVPGSTSRPGGTTSPAVAVGGATATASPGASAPTPQAGAGPTATPNPAASPSRSASASASPTRRVPPGQTSKSASPASSNGHGH